MFRILPRLKPDGTEKTHTFHFSLRSRVVEDLETQWPPRSESAALACGAFLDGDLNRSYAREKPADCVSVETNFDGENSRKKNPLHLTR